MDLLDIYEDSVMDASEPSLSQESACVNGTFGDPEILPRIGDEYQVKVPLLDLEYNRCQIIEVPTDREVIDEAAYTFVVGLPIPLTWIRDRVSGIRHDIAECHDHSGVSDSSGTGKLESAKEELMITIDEDSNLELKPYATASDENRLGEPTSGEYTVMDIENGGEVPLRQTELCKLNQQTDKGYLPVPGTTEKSWSDIEIESFLLGLYIFGKNLVQIRRFVESKEMGDILSYYYGKFYSSDGYRRWSECRKLRGRRSVHGQKIFTGSRQQELFSRLLPQVSNEDQNNLLQASKSFGEGKISLEDYVSKLKDTVGMKALIEAVGIGKGKQDLTGITDPVKTNQVVTLRQEIPTGKECNSLTSADIVKFLTGGFRLSKTRSNDLFWEAVWPRLLARGWHSEQPKHFASKHSLVFLIPGVKKFSRRRHVKGNHYFDSVSDVLNKVALDSSLIEVDIEAAGSNIKEEYQLGKEVKVDQDGSSDPQRHCYLRPKTSNCNSDLMKFTIVDTSSTEEEPLKIRELKTLPAGITINTSTPSSSSSENDDENSEEEGELDYKSMPSIDQRYADSSKSSKDILEKKLCPNTSENVSSLVKKEVQDNGSVIADVSRHASVVNDKNPRNVKSGRRIKPGQLNHMAPVTKRRRLTACANSETSIMKNRAVPSEFKEENSSCHLNSTEANANADLEVETYREKVPINCTAKSSSNGNGERISTRHSLTAEQSEENAEPRTMIDLNLPHLPQDFGSGEPCNTGAATAQVDPSEKGSSLPTETNREQDSHVMGTSNSVAGVENQPVAGARRQSTRNRPLTTRALEALECGFFNVKRRRRGAEDMVRDNLTPRASRRARVGIGTTTDLGGVATDILDPETNAVIEEGCSSNTDMVIGYQVCSERKGKRELVSIPQASFHPEILAGKDS
ncbi:hypothetical protein Scep_009072 [Stephania cephalantha]|uniref:SANT domain-containing protein n=1 Tax=Stephania cephalantha TaxID=152367 RepID=A0AAP0PFY6_9MAGN